MKSKSKTEQTQLARYAFNNQWWDLSVQATIAGKLWDHLEERFPLAYNDLFKRYTSGKEIPQSYAMAIARQESAWNPKVKSPVGASGLMQIMPGTATHTVKMFSHSWLAALVIAGSGNEYQHWHQLPAICLSAIWQ